MTRPIPILAVAMAAGILGVGPGWLALGCLALTLRDRRVQMLPLLLLVGGGILGASLAQREDASMRRLAENAAWMDGRARSFQALVHGPVTPTARGARIPLRLVHPLQGTVYLYLEGEAPPYRLGDRVAGRARFEPWRGPTNPGEFDLRRHRLSRGVSGRARARSAPSVLEPASSGPLSLGVALEMLRQRIRHGIHEATEDPAARGLALALTLGERHGIPQGLRTDFVRAGMAHLLAISGLHLALGALLVAGGVRFLLIPLANRLGPRSLLIVPNAAVIPLVLLQTLLAGAPTSCLRAAVMILHLVGARLLGRRADSATALGLAAVVNLGIHPGGLFEAGFQLSFGATGAILWALHGRASSPSRPWAARGLTLVRVSAAAFLGTAPAVGWHFGALPLISPATNLLAVPIASVALLPAALLLGAWGAVFNCGPSILGRLFELAAQAESSLAELAGSMGTSIALVHQDLPWTSLACVGLLGLLRRGVRARQPRRLILCAALAFLCATLPLSDPDLNLWLLDVGEGNLAVLRLPCGRVLLIDGGPPGTGRRILLPFLKTQGIRRVDDLVITHGHTDHYSGALEVFEELGSPRIITNRSRLIHEILKEQLGDVPDPAMSPCPEEASWVLCGATLRFFSPQDDLLEDLSENDRSLVVFLTHNDLSVVFTGDQGPKGWAAVAPRLPRGRVSLLQIPHHGHASPHLSPLLSWASPLFSFAFSDGSPKHGGNMGVWQKSLEYSCQYHVSGLHGPLQVDSSFRSILFQTPTPRTSDP